MSHQEEFEPAGINIPLQNNFNLRPQNEFVYIPSENIRERPFDQFSDNTSLPGFSYMTVSPSAVLRDIIPSPFASPVPSRGFRLTDFRQQNQQTQRRLQNDPFQTTQIEGNSRLVDFFLGQNQTNDFQPTINRQTQPNPKFVPKPLKIILAENQTGHSHSPSLSECDENSDDQGGFDKKKLTKGLKLLSVIVRDIVNEKVSTTYKEVAEVILKDTINLEQLNLSHKSMIAKEEQNIKRRVYDALNVLISAGVLVKDGKKVRKNENIHKIKINLKRTEMNSVQSKIVSLQEKNQGKN